jgi:phage-related protein
VYRGAWLVVHENPVKKGTFVRLSGRPEINTVSARGRTDFSIGLKAADPIKYEYLEEPSDGYRKEIITPISSGPTAGSAEVTLTNAGNISVPIIIELSKGFTVASELTLPSITNTTSDQEITIVEGTSATNQLEIDTQNREVLEVTYDSDQVTNVANGRAKVSTLIDWIYLEPGDNEIALANFPAGSTCTIFYRSGWIG